MYVRRYVGTYVRTVRTLLSKLPTRRVAMHMTLVGVVTQCADTAIFRGPSPFNILDICMLLSTYNVGLPHLKVFFSGKGWRSALLPFFRGNTGIISWPF